MTQKLEEARKLYQTANADQKYVLEKLFPELKESEDERIRKEIIEQINLLKSATLSDLRDKQFDSWIAWLEKQDEQIDIANKEYWRGYREGKQEILDKYAEIEKQGEQKSADKVEPKFKVGDWIVDVNDDAILHINKVLEYAYEVTNLKGGVYEASRCSIETCNRLWTIQDAKEGDVLFMDNGSANCIFIYKSFNNGIINKYASYNNFGFEGEHYLVLNDGYVVPATKEQRDLLLTKMREADYEFDFEKKEFKKVEQKPAWSEEVQEEQVSEEFISALGTMLNDGLPDRYLVSEERIKKSAIMLFSIARKQLKNEMQEWNEEDENMLKSIIATCELAEQDRDSSPARHLLEMQTNWLKSLKGRRIWKPSDEQMEALKGE